MNGAPAPARVPPGKPDQLILLARTSDDSGSTWSEPVDLSHVGRIIGPGGVIQNRKGWLIAPEWSGGLFALYSEDHGRTWQRGKPVPEISGAEPQLVELSDGRILMDIRQSRGTEHRWIAVSGDGGKTWEKARPALVTPGTRVACAIESYTSRSAGAL